MKIHLKLLVEHTAQLNVLLQDLCLDGFIFSGRKRYKLFLKRLSAHGASVDRIRVLIVITAGQFNHQTCSLDNAFQNRDFSGYMEKTGKSSDVRKIAWKTNDCIVAKAAQYVYNHVFLVVLGTETSLAEFAAKYELLWREEPIKVTI